MVRIFLLISLLGVLSGCASDGSDWEAQMMPHLDENADPSPHAMGNDAFNVRKPMPLGKKTSADFFFTRCQQSSQGSYYSRTSYECGTNR